MWNLIDKKLWVSIVIFILLILFMLVGIYKNTNILILLFVFILIFISLDIRGQEQANVSFSISGSGTVCSYGAFDFGTIVASNQAKNVSGLSNIPFLCNDYDGISNNPFQVIMLSGISNGTTHITPDSIHILADDIYDNCLNGIVVSSGFMDSHIDLMQKISVSDICDYSVIPEISFVLPANPSVGAYSGVIILTFPN